LGYRTDWRLLNASDYGVPQLRPRVVFMALRKDVKGGFPWPAPSLFPAPTVGDTLHDLLALNGWRMTKDWRKRANVVAPTIVGGSKKHGGPDLGPTRAKRAWASLGIDGMGIANEAPDRDFVGMPRLTVRMVARIQGFPDDWEFTGKKTAAYRQIGNAFPPPVAAAIASGISQSLQASSLTNIKTV
jgi:DNA (cytosine-5)-methyltransferase 1